MIKIVSDKEVSIGYSVEGKNSWSIVEYDRWNNNEKSLLLRLDKSGNFDVYFDFWGDEGLEKCTYALKGEDLELVPTALKNLMSEVVESGKTRVIRSNELKNKE